MGTFTSPSYPDVYPVGTNCTYVIDVTPGHSIQMRFLTFQLQLNDHDCQRDFVQVYDGRDMNTNNSLGR